MRRATGEDGEVSDLKRSKKNRAASFQATRLSHKDPWLSVTASRRVWLYLEIHTTHAFSQMSMRKCCAGCGVRRPGLSPRGGALMQSICGLFRGIGCRRRAPPSSRTANPCRQSPPGPGALSPCRGLSRSAYLARAAQEVMEREGRNSTA